MHCGYHVKEDSVSLAIVRFEIKDLVPHQVRSIIKFLNCTEIHFHLEIGELDCISQSVKKAYYF